MRTLECPRCKGSVTVVDAHVGRWRAAVTLQCGHCHRWWRSYSKAAVARARQAGLLKDYHGV